MIQTNKKYASEPKKIRKIEKRDAEILLSPMNVSIRYTFVHISIKIFVIYQKTVYIYIYVFQRARFNITITIFSILSKARFQTAW